MIQYDPCDPEFLLTWTHHVAPEKPAFVPYTFRVFLHTGETLDMQGFVPWLDWLQRLHGYQGIAHDKGFIPLHMIRYVVHLDTENKPVQTFTDNVVPMKRS